MNLTQSVTQWWMTTQAHAPRLALLLTILALAITMSAAYHIGYWLSRWYYGRRAWRPLRTRAVTLRQYDVDVEAMVDRVVHVPIDEEADKDTRAAIRHAKLVRQLNSETEGELARHRLKMQKRRKGNHAGSVRLFVLVLFVVFVLACSLVIRAARWLAVMPWWEVLVLAIGVACVMLALDWANACWCVVPDDEDRRAHEREIYGGPL